MVNSSRRLCDFALMCDVVVIKTKQIVFLNMSVLPVLSRDVEETNKF